VHPPFGLGNSLVTALAMRAQRGYNVTQMGRSQNRLCFKGIQRHRNAFPALPNGRRARLGSSGVSNLFSGHVTKWSISQLTVGLDSMLRATARLLAYRRRSQYVALCFEFCQELVQSGAVERPFKRPRLSIAQFFLQSQPLLDFLQAGKIVWG
jgi:hypothetical protein